MFGKFTFFKCLAEKFWQMNRSAKGLFVETTKLDGLVWQITNDLPNSPNFLLSCYTVINL